MTPVKNESQSLYEVLGVARDAKSTDIERAYRRIIAELQKETTPPDPRRRVLIEHAHDVLMDPVRRDAYDSEFRAPNAAIQRAKRAPTIAAASVAGALVLGGLAWWMVKPENQPRPIARSPQEILTAASLAVGRVYRIEMSGETAPLGLAFAIEEGGMITTCDGLSPNAELVVKFGKRQAPVRINAIDDEHGLCKLSGYAVGSWPLEVNRYEPKAGDKAYLVKTTGNGDVTLRETEVKQVGATPSGRFMDASVPIAPDAFGGPLIDIEGRVAGVAAAKPVPHYVAVPAAWIPEIRPTRRPQPVETAPEPAAKPATGPSPRSPVEISPERRERLEKAFNPPPNIPDDI